MPNFIKTRQDEVFWNLALDLSRKRWKERDTNILDEQLEPIRNIWAYANKLFQMIKSGEISQEELNQQLNQTPEVQNPVEPDVNKTPEVNQTQKPEPEVAQTAPEKSLVVESQGFINSDEDNQNWNAIKYHTFSTKKDLSEEQKYEHIEKAFLAYKTKHEGKPPVCRRKLLEFVNTYGSSMAGSFMGSGTGGMGGMMGFGGQRDERPIGPVVYGYDYPGVKRDVSSNSSADKKAIVVIPPKQDSFKATGEMDNQGNLKSDVENSQKIAVEKFNIDEQLDGEMGDVLVKLMDLTGISMSELQELDDEELEDLFKKASKLNAKNSQPLTEAVQETEILVERDSPIKKARKILAIKHKQKKSIEKVDGKKYVWNQNEIIKLMSKYGYKYDKKYKKWAKKRSPTYDARRILSDKYQDKLAVEKNEDGQYTLDQDDVRKRMHSHNYFYDLDKKRWSQQYDSPEQPKAVAVEPSVKYVPSTPSIIQPKTIIPIDNKSEPVSIKKEPEEKEPIEKVKIDKPVNPVYSLENKEKIKEMEARFILGSAHGLKNYTEFNKNEETGEYIPVVPTEEVLTKIKLLQYQWADIKNIWLNENNVLPTKLYEINESVKTIMARAFLAAIGKVNKIKIKEDLTPSVPYEDLDEDMESQDMYYDFKTERWKVIEEDEIDEEMNVRCSDINETDHDEEILCEEFSYEDESEELDEADVKSVDPKRNYNMHDVSISQGRFLLRILQLSAIKNEKDPKERNLFIQMFNDNVKPDGTPYDKDGGDPTAIGSGKGNNKYKVSKDTVIKNLEGEGYTFNNDKTFPMWVENGNIPVILNNNNIDKKEYIARGILGVNNTDFIQFKNDNPDKIQLDMPKMGVESEMEDRKGYIWNDKFGWLKNKAGDIENMQTTDEKVQTASIRPLLNQRYEDLNKDQQKIVKDFRTKKIRENHIGKKIEDMNASELKKADKYVKFNFDTNNTTGEMKKITPKPGFFRKILSKLGNWAKYLGTQMLDKNSPISKTLKGLQ